MDTICIDHIGRIKIRDVWTLAVSGAAFNDVSAEQIDGLVGQLFGSHGYDPLDKIARQSAFRGERRADTVIAVHRDAIAKMHERRVPVGPTRARRTSDLAAMAALPAGARWVERPTRNEDQEIDDVIARSGAGRCACHALHWSDGGNWNYGIGAHVPERTIVGSLCAACRTALFPVGAEHALTEAEENGDAETLIVDKIVPHARRYAALPHRCPTCVVAFDSSRKLGAHRGTAIHKTLEWIEYQHGIGNVILRARMSDGPVPKGLAGVIVSVYGLKPNEPCQHGWWRQNDPISERIEAKLDMRATRAIESISSLIAVPAHIADTCETALVDLISIEIARVEATAALPREERWAPEKPYAQRLRSTIFPLLVAVTARQRGFTTVNPLLKAAWGLGPLVVSDHRASGRIAHRIHEARREAFKMLGHSYFEIVNEIFGRYPGKLPQWARPVAE